MTPTHEQAERDKLIKQCEDLLSWCPTAKELADFIIADRKRITEPLVKLNKCYGKYTFERAKIVDKAIDETLKLAGQLRS